MIVDEILSHKKHELIDKKKKIPLAELRQGALDEPPTHDFAAAITGDDIKLIAEIKKASPARGVIRSEFNPVQIASIYAKNGAAAISVLTETIYFQGSLDYLKAVRKSPGSNSLPLLRKDFLFDPYHVYESRIYGADCILLIVALLNTEQLQELMDISRKLNMSCLVEVHNEGEVEVALKNGASIIGINNRDIKTLKVDMSTTERLRPLVPAGILVISESGIRNRNDVEKCRKLKVDAILVGQALMNATDIAARIRELM
jgi:indole-3-glycerol phosphate synthase